MTIRRATFWTSAAGAAWVLVGYPLTLALLPPTRRRTAPAAAVWTPTVSVVVCAYRERERLARKLAALRDLDYPAHLVEVIVAVDEDPATAEAARAALPEATVLFSRTRVGKVNALNRAAERATGEVVVFTDANNLLAAGTLRAIVERLAEPGVWGVAGRRSERGSAYDRYEDAIRRLESRRGSTAGMSGECVAVLRERLPRWPVDVVNDDFWLLCALVRAGGRVVYEPRAGGIEEAIGARDEVARRTRMAAGRVQLAGELNGLPAPFAVKLLSHKFGRLALPFFMAGALVSSALLAGRPRYRAALAAQLAVYGTGVAGIAGAGRRAGTWGFVPRAAGQFLLGNAAVARGVLRGVGKGQDVCWEPIG